MIYVLVKLERVSRVFIPLVSLSYSHVVTFCELFPANSALSASVLRNAYVGRIIRRVFTADQGACY